VLSHALALPRTMSGGKANVSLRFAAAKNVAHGHLQIGAEELRFGTIGPFSTEIVADLDGDRLSGRATVKGFGDVGASWNVTLAGSPMNLSSLRNATGAAEVRLSDADLTLLDGWLPAESPVANAEGRGDAKLEISRANKLAKLPSVKLIAVTRGLAVVHRGSRGVEPRRIEGVDFDASGSFDGESGETSVQAVLRDAKGGLASIAGKVRIDAERLVNEPELAFAELVEAPIDVRVGAPSRRISDLPEALRIPDVDGDFGWEAVVHGSLRRPTIHAKLDGRGVVAAGSTSAADVHAEAEYDWSSSALRGHAEAKAAKELIASIVLDAKVPAMTPEDFEGSLRLDLKGMPLDFAGALAKSSVGGRAFGNATLSKLRGKSAMSADLRVANAVIARTALGEAKIKVATEGAIVSASAALEGGRGSFKAEGKAGLTWVGPIPSLSTDVPVRGSVVAKGFSLVSVPGASASSRLGGRVDANFTVALDSEIDDKHRVNWSARVDGSAVVQDGTAYVDVLGVDVHDINFRVKADGKGKGTHISVADIKGRLRSTTDNVGGSAELDFDGFTFAGGAASVHAKTMPLFIHGAPQGQVTGEATLRLKSEPQHMLLAVDVPTLNFKLPELSARKVIDVSDNPEIVILQSKTPAARSGTVWKIPIHLGSAVSIHRSDIEVNITGTPVVELGSETRLSGAIELIPGGRIPVLGQVFAIDKGLITFDTPAMDNPAVDVTAQWRTPDKTFVYVRVTGRLKEVQVALRSDPPLPQREVFALLFGGTSEEPPGSTEGPNANGAARTAAMQAPVSQLNKLLGQSPVELRVGSTSQSKPCYTAAVRIRDNLWFEASTFKQSDYSGGSNAEQNVVAGTIDYRFSRSWSLRTQAGSLGGALDLLWQHRY
jgi:autotransporter translocation and assembly factor TamB